MAKKKFTQLPLADELTGEEIVAVVQSGSSKQTTAQDIADLSSGVGGAWGSITGTLSNQTDLQGVLDAKASSSSVTTVSNNLADHISDSSDAHAASAITNTPAGGVSAITVQEAINELDSEKQSSLGFTPENVGNKANDFSVINTTLYPNVQAVDGQFAQLAPTPFVIVADYTLLTGDQKKTIIYDDPSTVLVTVPQDTFPVGTWLFVGRASGSGVITFVEGGTTVIEDTKGDLNDAGDGTITPLYQYATNVWMLLNGLPESTSGTAWQLSGASTLTTPTLTGVPTLIGNWIIQRNGIGVTVSDGIVLENTTAAALDAQQASPRLRFKGFGWKSDATTASRSVEFDMYVLPVQASVNPQANWLLRASINGGAYANCIEVTGAGNTTINGLLTIRQTLGSSQALITASAASTQFTVTQEGLVTISQTSGGHRVKEGTNASMGLSTLVAGTVTVSNTRVTASSRIFPAVRTAGGTQGHLSYTIVPGTSFTITSTSATETSTVNWLIIEPAP